jgi:hypothetical protein
MPSTTYRALALLVACCFAAQIRAADITLAKDGQSAFVISVPRNAPAALRRGATEVANFIGQMADVTLPVVEASSATSPSHAISIRIDSTLGAETYALRETTEGIEIRAGDPRGAMYGCTALLEQLGVRFLTPAVTRVPKRSTLTVASVDLRSSPAFEYREVFFTEAFDKDWAARLKLNGHHHQLDESTGGKVTYGRFVHTFDELVPRSEYERHPEYFPLINGKRKNDYVQRCLTNADVLRLTIEKTRQWIRENPSATIFSVSQNDTGNWCECEQCAAITKQYGAHSGLYLSFVNQVADAIEKEHPDKLIDTLAYQFTEAPPIGIKPRPNVRVRLCPISCCDAHPYEQCTAPANREFVARLRGWSAITDSLYIWHYNTNFANYLLPFPDFDQFPDSIRLYRKAGVKGIFFEGGYAPGGYASDAELRTYVMAKLLWDPNSDADALVNEWMTGIYGTAARPMREWFDLKQQQVRDPARHVHIYDGADQPYLADDVLARGEQLHADALRLAADDVIATEYIAKSLLWIHYAKLLRHPALGAEFDAFMSDARKRGITQFREGESLDAFEKRYTERARGAAK